MEKKKYDLILIGPQIAGKTALLRTLQGEEPSEHYATQSNGEGKTIGSWFDKINPFHKNIFVLDAGGKFNEFEKYSLWCKEAKKIVFVFNGCEMLEEVLTFESAGKNTSFCRRVCSDLEKDKDANICFVATHKDLYQGKNLVSEIQQSIEKANKTYGEQFPNLSKRYHPFSKMMNGRLFAVNALDKDEVKVLFEKIAEL